MEQLVWLVVGWFIGGAVGLVILWFALPWLDRYLERFVHH